MADEGIDVQQEFDDDVEDWGDISEVEEGIGSDMEDEDEEDRDRRFLVHVLVQYHIQLASVPTIALDLLREIVRASERADPIPYHTSALSSAGWVAELLNGHPERIRTELAVHKHVFKILLTELQEHGHTHSKNISLEEQLAIFLYACVTGLLIRHIGERFQRSNGTVSKYFKKLLFAFSSRGIYTKYVRLPREDEPVHTAIRDDPKFYPFFKDALGAIDGTHIACAPAADERDTSRNRKGFLSQNCLMCCDFDMRFTYVLSGWEGSKADASVYHDARMSDLKIPNGKYYLADAGYPCCPELLVPYRGQRYHLAEWGRTQIRPRNAQECYNLRHAQLRNIIERIIGVLKRRFRILVVPPEYPMSIQARIPPALCCVHNVIRKWDPVELEDIETAVAATSRDLPENVGQLADGVPTPADRDEMSAVRDKIAGDIWASYAAERACRGEPIVPN